MFSFLTKKRTVRRSPAAQNTRTVEVLGRALPLAIRIAQKTLKIVRQNIVFALAVKLGVLVLSALGEASMWAAVFADVGVSVLAILNASRALNTKGL